MCVWTGKIRMYVNRGSSFQIIPILCCNISWSSLVPLHSDSLFTHIQIFISHIFWSSIHTHNPILCCNTFWFSIVATHSDPLCTHIFQSSIHRHSDCCIHTHNTFWSSVATHSDPLCTHTIHSDPLLQYILILYCCETFWFWECIATSVFTHIHWCCNTFKNTSVYFRMCQDV